MRIAALSLCLLLAGCYYTPGDGSFNERLDAGAARIIERQNYYGGGCCWDYHGPVYKREHWR